MLIYMRLNVTAISHPSLPHVRTTLDITIRERTTLSQTCYSGYAIINRKNMLECNWLTFCDHSSSLRFCCMTAGSSKYCVRARFTVHTHTLHAMHIIARLAHRICHIARGLLVQFSNKVHIMDIIYL